MLKAETSAPVDTGSSAPAPALDTTPVDTAPKETAAPAEDSIDDTLRDVFRARNATRNEDGKFAPRDGKPAETPATEGQPPTEAPIEPQAAKATAIDPPNSWTAERKAEFGTLPPAMQEYIAQRESSAHQAITRLGQFAKSVEPITQVLETNRQIFERNGVGYQEGLQTLLKAQDALDKNPVEAIKWLANAYGVDLGQAAGVDEYGLPPDPQVTALQRKIEQLEARDRERDTASRQAAERAQQATMKSYEGEIDKFAADKPDFWDVDMAVMVAAVQAEREANPGASRTEILAAAYEKATWASPKTRATRLEAEQAKRLQSAKAEAEKAKRASSINVKGSPKNTGPGDIDSDLRGIWRKNNAS